MDTDERISELADNLILRMINIIYVENGFYAALDEIERRLEYGRVKKINGLYRITTGGWSDDEALLNSLCSILSNKSIPFFIPWATATLIVLPLKQKFSVVS